MNPHIKDLAEQATRKYDRLGFEIPFAQPDLELFAELIIKECAEVCVDRGKMHDGLYSSWASDCARRIEKHFEVK